MSDIVLLQLFFATCILKSTWLDTLRLAFVRGRR